MVIPTLDEAEHLPELLAALRAQRDVRLELIVADGGSTDATVAIARAHGAAVVDGARGRGAQMNAGARAATAPTLLFLHADTVVDSDPLLRPALDALAAAAARTAGHFPLRFATTVPGHERLFRYLEGKTRLNRPYTINGDQGLLIGSGYFRELGGFDTALPFLEDQRIAARIFATGRWIVLPGEIATSARRFEREGHRQRYTLMALTMALHAAGVDEFFARAPAVYVGQREARALDVRPFAALIRRIFRERRGRGLAGTWLRIGRFVRENAWQLAYHRDVTRGDGELRCLARFDRWVAPLLANQFWDAVAALAAAGWFYCALPLDLRSSR